MISRTHRAPLAFCLTLVLGLGVALLEKGVYGWLLFVIIPFAVGLLAACIARPANKQKAVALGGWAMLGISILLVAFALDGIVGIMMALPIVLPLSCLGAWVGFLLQEPTLEPRQGAVMLVLPLAAFTWDVKAPPPVFQVTSQVVVHATPEQVWKHVISFPNLPEAREWLFRTGLAYPTEARIDGRGPGAIRKCQFSTGSFVEPITAWDEPHLLRFRVTDNSASLEEWSPWGAIHPKHLRGYLISEGGQFQLTPLSGGRTLLTGTTWYRHSLWPAQYWRWWSDWVIHRIHLRVLDHVRNLAEHEAEAVEHP